MQADPAFLGRYDLAGEDEVRIRAIFPPPVVAYLAQHPSVCLERIGGQLVRYLKGSQVEHGEIAGSLQEGLEVLNLLVHEADSLDNFDLT